MKSTFHAYKLFLILIGLTLASLACRAEANLPDGIDNNPADMSVETATPLPAAPVTPGSTNPTEPTTITGKIPYTSPFFLNSTSEPFVLLEDEAGFVRRDRDFAFPLAGQAMGPVTIQEDDTLTYDLALPSIPQGTYVDVDNNDQKDTGVQVFAVAYWDNTWGGPFLEERDGTGWSTAYTSAVVDPNKDDEIVGGTLVVWSPDDQQSFPTGFGVDGKLFTADDPTAMIPAGYNLVNLDETPFRFSKEARPVIELKEGVVAVNDFSELNYSDAFEALFQKASREYPFTAEKGLDWKQIYTNIKPLIDSARNPQDFYRALRAFAFAIPDGHVGVQLDSQVFFEENGGGFGLVLSELSDGRVIVTEVIPGSPAAQAGILPGAEIVTWDGKPVQEAIAQVIPALGPYSSDQARRMAQIIFLTRVPPNTTVNFSYKNPIDLSEKQVRMSAAMEYDSLFSALQYNAHPILPIEAKILDSGLGYIKINTFDDDYHLMAQLWERYIQDFKDNEVPGIILDLRSNSGGNSNLANNFAGFFFDKQFDLYRRAYYNETTGQFEFADQPEQIKPAPIFFDRPLAVLVSPDCVSACEGFAYTLQHDGRATIVGSAPSAGAFGEVGRGQYRLPEGLNMQLPTGRPETMDGQVPIEGTGVIPDILVPVTEESALGKVDSVLQAAIDALLAKIQ